MRATPNHALQRTAAAVAVAIGAPRAAVAELGSPEVVDELILVRRSDCS